MSSRQCLHLGVVLKGAFKVTYLDGGEEIVRQGDAYSLEPGHFVQTLEPTEVLEFSPPRGARPHDGDRHGEPGGGAVLVGH